MELGLIENLQREDLNPAEEARGFQTLMEEYGLTQEQVADRMGKSRPAIANTPCVCWPCRRICSLWWRRGPSPPAMPGHLGRSHSRELQREAAKQVVSGASPSVRPSSWVKLLQKQPEGDAEGRLHRRDRPLSG